MVSPVDSTVERSSSQRDRGHPHGDGVWMLGAMGDVILTGGVVVVFATYVGDHVCPGCGQREIDTISGLCSPCVVDQAALRYQGVDHELAERRAHAWSSTVAHSRVDRTANLRKRRQRLTERIRPTMPASSLDPWEVAAEAIAEVVRLEQRYAQSRPELEAIAEALRRLAWGPDEQERRQA
jgi:hypothetical protein